MPPTSIRLSAAQEAELGELARDLNVMRADLAAVARGGALTPGAVLRLAVARGLAELRREIDTVLDAPPSLSPPPAPIPALTPSAEAEAVRDPFEAVGAPADDLAGPVVRPVVLPAPRALTAGDLARLCAAVPPSAPILVRQGEGWFDIGGGEVSDGRPVNEGDPDDPGCEVGWDVRQAGRRAPRGRWCRVLTFE